MNTLSGLQRGFAGARLIVVVAALAAAFTAGGCTSCDPPAQSEPDAGPAVCVVASANCPCDDTRCDTGLVCQEGTCRAVATTGLKIASPLARSCEVLVQETNGKLADVAFSGAVTGRVVREGDRAALAFHANSDAAIGGDAVEVAFTGAVETADQALQLVSARCFDQSGAALPGSGLSF